MESGPQGAGTGATGPTRRYDNSRRAAEASATRARIVDAAAGCFADDGYAATSVRAIAERAGVSPESVYANFGTKSALLRAWIDRAVVGDDEPVALLDRTESVAARNAGTLAERRRAQMALVRRINERVAVPMRVLAAASQGDPELAAISADYERRRRSDIVAFVASPADVGSTSELDPATLDLLALWTSAEVYARLVLDGGWSPDQYEAELARLVSQLVERDRAD